LIFQPNDGNNFTQDMVEAFVMKNLSKLMTSCFILRLADFTIYQVSTSGAKKHIPKEFIAGKSPLF